MMICAIGSHVSLLPEGQETTPFGIWQWFHKFVGNAGFYLIARNHLIVQFELISLYIDCLLELEELGFSLDLTLSALIKCKLQKVSYYFGFFDVSKPHFIDKCAGFNKT